MLLTSNHPSPFLTHGWVFIGNWLELEIQKMRIEELLRANFNNNSSYFIYAYAGKRFVCLQATIV